MSDTPPLEGFGTHIREEEKLEQDREQAIKDALTEARALIVSFGPQADFPLKITHALASIDRALSLLQ